MDKQKTLDDYRQIAVEMYGQDSHAVKCLNLKISAEGNIAPSTSENIMMNLLAKWHAKTGIVFEKPVEAPKENPTKGLFASLKAEQ